MGGAGHKHQAEVGEVGGACGANGEIEEEGAEHTSPPSVCEYVVPITAQFNPLPTLSPTVRLGHALRVAAFLVTRTTSLGRAGV